MFNNLCNKFFKLTRLKIRRINIFTSSVLVLSTFCGTLTAFAEGLYQVRVVIDGKWHVYNTMDVKVSELFEKENIKLTEKDIVDINLDTVIDKDMVINIDTAETVKFIIDEKEEVEFLTNKGLVGTAIKEFCEETNKKVFLDEGQSSASNINDNMVIKVSYFKEEIKTIKEEIPFKTETVENPDLPEGKINIKTKGVNGIKETTIKEVYREDKLESKNIIEEKVTKEPITEIIEKGTKKNTIKTEKGIFVIDKKINMKSTAYTAGPESTGKRPGDAGYGITASGMKAQRGVVAVDTSVIPFGTELYIEGYGYAIAGDTGSAIKGNKIDVFFDKYNDAIQYGVRNVNVYVLGEKVA
ncbi:3D domain-containing protein [[Clostridium] colinum]|uniref:3D domain-containing protein n=1 Tax=[Clostridium] colinum TaxID=36835 RepID=UPI002024113A|nr:3D domain-containing protein [[Clostridium] colinum]